MLKTCRAGTGEEGAADLGAWEADVAAAGSGSCCSGNISPMLSAIARAALQPPYATEDESARNRMPGPCHRGCEQGSVRFRSGEAVSVDAAGDHSGHQRRTSAREALRPAVASAIMRPAPCRERQALAVQSLNLSKHWLGSSA